jgi:ribosomal protein S18 acetylase RimI-like enzyme
MLGAIVIRLLTPGDADAYLRVRLLQVELEPNAFAESPIEVRGKTTAAIAERLAAPRDVSFIVGAFADGEIVATAGYFRRVEIKMRHKGRVWGVFVAPALRRQGLGRAIMNTLIAEARTIEGLEQLDLTVAETQTAAKRLYESLGLAVYGRETRSLKVGDVYVDEDLMHIQLSRLG